MGKHYTHLLIPDERDSKPAPEQVVHFFGGVMELSMFAGPTSLFLTIGNPLALAKLEGTIGKRKRDYDVRLSGALTPGFQLVRTRSDERVKKASFTPPFPGASPSQVVALDAPDADPDLDCIEAEAWETPPELQEQVMVTCHVQDKPVAWQRFTSPWLASPIEIPTRGGSRFWIALHCFEKYEAPVFFRQLDLAHPRLVAVAEKAFNARFRQGCTWG